MRQTFSDLATRDSVLRAKTEDIAMRLLRDLHADSENRGNFSNEVAEAYHNDPGVVKAYMAAWAYLVRRGYLIERANPGWFFISIAGDEEKHRILQFGLPVPINLPDFGRRWRIERELGSGGQGITYLAHDLKENGGNLFVLKQLRATGNEQARQRFAQEAQVLSGLDHPNVLRVVDMD